MMKFKYHNRKITNEDGTFDSKLEWQRWLYLKRLDEQGEIAGLRRQVEFELLPRQTEEVEVKLKTKVKIVEKFLEHPVVYKADFVYDTNFERVVEDTKGFHTPDYIIKRKLMLFRLGIKIKEIKKANEPVKTH